MTSSTYSACVWLTNKLFLSGFDYNHVLAAVVHLIQIRCSTCNTGIGNRTQIEGYDMKNQQIPTVLDKE